MYEEGNVSSNGEVHELIIIGGAARVMRFQQSLKHDMISGPKFESFPKHRQRIVKSALHQ